MTDQLTADRYDAVLFDRDGVITDTAAVHTRAWETMFDECLQRRARQRGEPFEAGRIGGSALVVGVDRDGSAKALRNHGADVVVASLAELLA